ncbi:MAG: hypothetical protein WB816_07955 [Methylocystis sp.]
MRLRRLEASDARAFQSPRIEGFRLQPGEFRYAAEDEAEFEARLARDFVVGVLHGETLVGIAGLTRQNGLKINHKALPWGCICAPNFVGAAARAC